jgi:hypothetical protein
VLLSVYTRLLHGTYVTHTTFLIAVETVRTYSLRHTYTVHTLLYMHAYNKQTAVRGAVAVTKDAVTTAAQDHARGTGGVKRL